MTRIATLVLAFAFIAPATSMAKPARTMSKRQFARLLKAQPSLNSVYKTHLRRQGVTRTTRAHNNGVAALLGSASVATATLSAGMLSATASAQPSFAAKTLLAAGTITGAVATYHLAKGALGAVKENFRNWRGRRAARAATVQVADALGMLK